MKKLIAVLTNNDDDIYCFRKELIEAFIDEGYEVLISCPYGEKFELMKDVPYIYDDPDIDRRGTNVVSDGKLFLHYRREQKRSVSGSSGFHEGTTELRTRGMLWQKRR